MTAPIGYPEKFGAILDAKRAETPRIAPSVTGEKVLAPNFAEQVQNFVGQINASQKAGETAAENFASGKSNDIHGTMIAVEQAEISLHLLANVRNKMIDMYREVMRMGS